MNHADPNTMRARARQATEILKTQLLGTGAIEPLVALYFDDHIEQVIVPPYPGLCSAMGLLLTDVKHAYVQSRLRPFDAGAGAEIESLFATLGERARRETEAEGTDFATVGIERLVDLRYHGQGYELTVPLNSDGHIDATSWMDDPAACTVRRIRPGKVDALGALARSAHGRWYFDYASGHDAQDHQGIRFGDDRFAPQALVGINEDDGKTHAFRIVSVDEIEPVE